MARLHFEQRFMGTPYAPKTRRQAQVSREHSRSVSNTLNTVADNVPQSQEPITNLPVAFLSSCGTMSPFGTNRDKPMRTAQQASDNSGIPLPLIRAVIRTVGKDNLEDLMNHGADGGFPGITYYSDTVAFFKRHRSEIVSLVNQMADDLGENPADMVAGFGCLAGHDVHRLPDHEKRRKLQEYLPSVSRCLYGGRLTDDDTQTANALTWFACEQVARAMCDE